MVIYHNVWYYCYHSDHLGSATWITTKTGQPVEYLHYMPYGELWRDQRATSYNERFRFTGKERDSETGYDYFGARYYSSTLPAWLSVDPLSDKYPNVSPYAYCNWNPIKFVDPNGEIPLIPIVVAYYSTAKVLESSAGYRNVRTAGYLMQHPFISIKTGMVDFPSGGISNIACNFQINLQNDAGFSKNDGGQGNAYRHALWQALLTDAFGEDHAKRIGDAHENRVPDDMNVRLFQGLEDADAMADMLNNIIGRRIGSDNKGASNKKMAEHVLEEYRNHGLWSVDKTRNGYSLQKKNLSVEQYNQALQVIQNKGNNGLNIE